jgi:hypothetical protein
MKTIFRVTMLFAFVAFANTLFAMGNLNVNILPINSEKAVVSVSALTNCNFSIKIVNEKNQIVYYNENSIPGEYYRKVFNFSDLEDGEFTLSVASGNLKTERSFQKTRRSIQVGTEKTTLDPFFSYKNDILKFTYMNFMNENITLSFYENNQKLYSKAIGKTFNVVEALDLSKVEKGNYLAVLRAGSKEYLYPINIE